MLCYSVGKGMNARYFLDFDNVLFDTEKLRDILAQRAQEATNGQLTPKEFFSAYEESKTNGYLDLNKVIAYFRHHFQLDEVQARQIFLEAPFSQCLFPETVPLLRQLGEHAYVYSLGDADGYQWTKILGSGILAGISQEQIVVTQDKDQGLPPLLEQIQGEGVNEITIVDDKGSVLDTAIETADRLGLSLHPFHLVYGKYKDEPLRHSDRMTVVGNLTELHQRLPGLKPEGTSDLELKYKPN